MEGSFTDLPAVETSAPREEVFVSDADVADAGSVLNPTEEPAKAEAPAEGVVVQREYFGPPEDPDEPAVVHIHDAQPAE